MDATQYLTTRQVAERFRTADSTVRYWRSISYGPQGVRIGRRVLYLLSDIEAWEHSLRAGGAA